MSNSKGWSAARSILRHSHHLFIWCWAVFALRHQPRAKNLQKAPYLGRWRSSVFPRRGGWSECLSVAARGRGVVVPGSSLA